MSNDFRNFEIPGVVTIQPGEGELPVVMIKTVMAEARIYLHGAQLTHWQPMGTDPVIFLSKKSLFAEGKAIRGGVPVCFPWFGPPPSGSFVNTASSQSSVVGSSSLTARLPAHGFVRNRSWKLESVEQIDAAIVRVIFSTVSDASTREKWPHDYRLRLIYNIGPSLTMALEVENPSAAPFTFSEALHTYLLVSHVRSAVITGLENTSYRDFPDRTVLLQQDGSIHFTGETDRVYVNTTATCVLTDPVLRRRISVEKSGSSTTTVWNPWITKSAAMSDFGSEEWPQMVCIETVNSHENSITLAPGEKHTMTARISVDAL